MHYRVLEFEKNICGFVGRHPLTEETLDIKITVYTVNEISVSNRVKVYIEDADFETTRLIIEEHGDRLWICPNSLSLC